MPIYEYECSSCNRVIEVFQRMTEDPLTNCPDCSGQVKKLVSRSSFQLKGSGWYADGYSSNSSNGSGCAEKNKPAECPKATSDSKSGGASEKASAPACKSGCAASTSSS